MGLPRLAEPIIAVRITSTCFGKEGPCRVDANGVYTCFAKHVGETAFTASNVQSVFEIACLNTLHHWSIKHELAAEITVPVAPIIGEGHGPLVHNLQETRGTAAMLNIRPAGFRHRREGAPLQEATPCVPSCTC